LGGVGPSGGRRARGHFRGQQTFHLGERRGRPRARVQRQRRVDALDEAPLASSQDAAVFWRQGQQLIVQLVHAQQQLVVVLVNGRQDLGALSEYTPKNELKLNYLLILFFRNQLLLTVSIRKKYFTKFIFHLFKGQSLNKIYFIKS
jgi:hypothetical protein